MVVMPRMHAQTMHMTLRMVVEQRLAMAQRVPSRLPLSTAAAV